MEIRLEKWSMEDEGALTFLMDRADRQYLSDRLPKPYTLEDARWWLEMVSRQEGKTGLFRKILVDGRVVGISPPRARRISTGKMPCWAM